VLSKTEGGGPAGASCIRNAENLEHRDDRGLVRRDAVDALTQVEGEVELPAAHALHPSPIESDRDAHDLVPLVGERFLDRLDGLEDQQVRGLTERRHSIE
jgi:hypothetical protein